MTGRQHGDGTLRRDDAGLHVRSLHLERRSFVLDVETLCIPGGLTILAGPNGSGKTTLLSHLAGRLGGAAAAELDGRPLSPSRVALMAQSPQLPKDLTPRELLAQVAWLGGLSRADAREQAELVIDQIDLAGRATAPIRQLSGGMQRRLAFGACLVLPADLLLLDEPTNDLDPRQRQQLLSLVRQESAVRPVVVATHALRDVFTVADQVLVLTDGRILFAGATSEFLHRYAEHSADPEVAYAACIDSGTSDA